MLNASDFEYSHTPGGVQIKRGETSFEVSLNTRNNYVHLDQPELGMGNRNARVTRKGADPNISHEAQIEFRIPIKPDAANIKRAIKALVEMVATEGPNSKIPLSIKVINPETFEQPEINGYFPDQGSGDRLRDQRGKEICVYVDWRKTGDRWDTGLTTAQYKAFMLKMLKALIEAEVKGIGYHPSIDGDRPMDRELPMSDTPQIFTYLSFMNGKIWDEEQDAEYTAAGFSDPLKDIQMTKQDYLDAGITEGQLDKIKAEQFLYIHKNFSKRIANFQKEIRRSSYQTNDSMFSLDIIIKTLENLVLHLSDRPISKSQAHAASQNFMENFNKLPEVQKEEVKCLVGGPAFAWITTCSQQEKNVDSMALVDIKPALERWKRLKAPFSEIDRRFLALKEDSLQELVQKRPFTALQFLNTAGHMAREYKKIQEMSPKPQLAHLSRWGRFSQWVYQHPKTSIFLGVLSAFAVVPFFFLISAAIKGSRIHKLEQALTAANNYCLGVYGGEEPKSNPVAQRLKNAMAAMNDPDIVRAAHRYLQSEVTRRQGYVNKASLGVDPFQKYTSKLAKRLGKDYSEFQVVELKETAHENFDSSPPFFFSAAGNQQAGSNENQIEGSPAGSRPHPH